MAVFGAISDKPTILKAGRANVSTDAGGEMIALGVTVQYQRQVEQVPVIGSKRVISIGEPQGTVSFESVISKESLNSAFHLNDDGCSPFTLSLTFGNGTCDEGSSSAVKCLNCVASAVSVTAQGGRGYIGQGIQATFTALDM